MSLQLLPLFLWISVLAWGVALGAKLFDLVVVTGAWAAAPPRTLALLPYGPRFRVNPGHFFLPVSLVVVTGAIGALIAGWSTPAGYRLWLCAAALPVAGIWLITIPFMWPLNATLQAAGHDGGVGDPAGAARAAFWWVVCDRIRVVMAATGFVAAIRALNLPVPQ